MNGTKKQAKYNGVSLPITLIEEIKNYISINKEGWSVAGFVKKAVKEKMGTSKRYETSVDGLKIELILHSRSIK